MKYLHCMRIAAALLLMTFTLLLGCCCGGGSKIAAPPAPDYPQQPSYLQPISYPTPVRGRIVLPNLNMRFPGGAPNSLVPHSTSGAAYEVDLLAYTSSSGLTEKNDSGFDYIQLRPNDQGNFAWVMYSAEMPAGKKLAELFIDVDDADLEDEEWYSALPWWVGIANYTTGRWEWHGAYNDFMASPSVNHNFPREAYLDGDGFAHWIILSYCPPDCSPAIMSVWAMEMDTDDI